MSESTQPTRRRRTTASEPDPAPEAGAAVADPEQAPPEEATLEAGLIHLGAAGDVEMVKVGSEAGVRLHCVCYGPEASDHLSEEMFVRADLNVELARVRTCGCGRIVLWASALRAAAAQREADLVARAADEPAHQAALEARRAARLAADAALRAAVDDIGRRVAAIEAKLGLEPPPPVAPTPA